MFVLFPMRTIPIISSLTIYSFPSLPSITIWFTLIKNTTVAWIERLHIHHWLPSVYDEGKLLLTFFFTIFLMPQAVFHAKNLILSKKEKLQFSKGRFNFLSMRLKALNVIFVCILGAKLLCRRS